MFHNDTMNWLSRFLFDNFRLSTPGDAETTSSILELSAVGSWVVLFVLLSGVMVYLLCKTKIFEWLSKHVLLLATIIWIGGTLLYIVGFNNGHVNGLSVVLRAIISSFRMFVVSHDLARVDSNLHKNTLYMLLFAITHFAAAFITFLFIFKMVGYKIKSYINILMHRFIYSNNSVVHLFWGVNDASCLLAESIHRDHETETIIFIDIDNDDENNNQKQVTLSRITNIMTIHNSEIARLDKIGALVEHCYGGPADVSGAAATNIFKALHLKSIGKIVHKSNTVNFYFLSDDEAANISGALNLQQDVRLRQRGCDKCSENKKEERLSIYVHARKTASNEILNNYSRYNNSDQCCDIKIVDSACLAVKTLKTNSSTLPVKCVKVGKLGTVNSDFNSLIVGFGVTGQEAFKFLYEFSAFVGTDLKRVPFHCYAVDENMDKIAGEVRNQMPDIKENELSLIKSHTGTQEFWDKVNQVIPTLNYAVIAINNDNEAIALAVNLFKVALRLRDDSRCMLKIMVRCYQSSNKRRMQEVIDSLTYSATGAKVKIMLFGDNQAVYNYNLIQSDVTNIEAMEFNRVYNNADNAVEKWEADFGREAIERIMEEKRLNRYHAICELSRQMSQNISNSLHGRTKLILMGIEPEKHPERLELYMDYIKSRAKYSTNYTCGGDEAQLLLNMAIVEHERWIAAHRIMGYTHGKSKDAVHQYHPSICPWAELDEKTQSYDCDVVDTTIKLAYNQLITTQPNGVK